MIEKFCNETVIITKEAWFFLKDLQRKKAGCPPLNSLQRDKVWARASRYRNNGASYSLYPVTENEIRIDSDSFCFSLAQIKEKLSTNGFTFRQDGFFAEGIYM